MKMRMTMMTKKRMMTRKTVKKTLITVGMTMKKKEERTRKSPNLPRKSRKNPRETGLPRRRTRETRRVRRSRSGATKKRGIEIVTRERG